MKDENEIEMLKNYKIILKEGNIKFRVSFFIYRKGKVDRFWMIRFYGF